MKIISTNNINFSSRYRTNINQRVITGLQDLRNTYISVWAERARNSEDISGKLAVANLQRKCNVVFNIDDKFDKQFERDMKMVGQKYRKI